MIAGLASLGATRAAAAPPETSLRPILRGDDLFKRFVPSVEDILSEANLSGDVAFAVADANTGRIIEAHQPLLPLPPASTAKALTTLWALERLGPTHRFTTRLLATGPVVDGRIDGDLVLAGGGDPTLDTDALMEMASALKDMGVREVAGNLKVWSGALPDLHEIDREQPDHVGYNPAVSGLNLNFNRVHFGWSRKGGSYDVTMDARSANAVPPVQMARMQVVDRSSPIYTYARSDAYDEWTVARGALGNAGARWLPVRDPAHYAGEVFQTLLRSHGIIAAGSIETAESDEGETLHSRTSDPLPDLLRDMMTYSTNLTAEVMGLSASSTLGPVDSLAESADRMNGWLRETYGMRAVDLEDHSGLGDDSRVTATDMVRAMVGAGPDGALRALMKPFALDGDDFTVDAKTGTLNFVSALTGYVSGPAGGPLAFSIMCGDIPRRDALTVAQREKPEGGSWWNGRAKIMQRALIDRWGKLYLT
ncbi:D-alanyl-D-alanine carboxypeptidase DacB precursor [Rhodobacteraceae bacterium THAF1]|uniref:D-alanyl-D-alanine carboxypeptidase/D-alanyl-D-alanine endopeptidase n=1 Tax=Palleronia sp. THAF1 TaxID=2587842 RepID=UPI000F3FDE50|nr:D-alanyl-D-alanine carboxypeptidase/D-alanyl-D-alanine-endopeptidase [Palleronia sp. THAF1]QFU07532.1 D-alanyl-D-alanine carboxypeptidase DacB precursor [Palleronia sp. THAF1]VDC20495.1 D-alanyl-D-alanine carboxypeptidase DacB precursor [Rhodobacteraceae bacterium THAF1]